MSNATATAHSTGMSDINITPLIDVMLVVLVIFMIAVPVTTRTLTTDLPKVGSGEPSKVEPLLLRIGSEGSYSLDGRPVTRASLAGLLGNATGTAADGTALTLKVQVEGSARYEAVAQALAVAKNAGIDRIVMDR